MFWSSDASAGTAYAANNGIRVTSHSYGAAMESSRFYLDDLRDIDGVFLAAAGNDTEDLNGNGDYYAAGKEATSEMYENAMNVASLNKGSSALSSFSNYDSGLVKVNIAAPGSYIYSTSFTPDYSLKSGTSMATPHVAGAAALILSYKPTLTWEEIIDALCDAAVKNPALAVDKVAEGRILDVDAAIKSIGGYRTTSPISGEILETGLDKSITWDTEESGGNVKIELYKVDLSKKNSVDRWAKVRDVVVSAPNNGSYNWTLPNDLISSDNYHLKISKVGTASTYGMSSPFTIDGIIPEPTSLFLIFNFLFFFYYCRKDGKTSIK